MCEFKSFRIGANLFDSGETDFYFKIEDDAGHVLCNFCVDKRGLYYYKKSSQILTPAENENTRNSWDGFLSFNKLDILFLKLNEMDCQFLDGDDSSLSIRRDGSRVIIEKK